MRWMGAGSYRAWCEVLDMFWAWYRLDLHGDICGFSVGATWKSKIGGYSIFCICQIWHIFWLFEIFDTLCILYRLSVDWDAKHNRLKEEHKLERACQDLIDGRKPLWSCLQHEHLYGVLRQYSSTYTARCKAARSSHSVRPKISLTDAGTDLITISMCVLSFKTVATPRNAIVFKIKVPCQKIPPESCTHFST